MNCPKSLTLGSHFPKVWVFMHWLKKCILCCHHYVLLTWNSRPPVMKDSHLFYLPSTVSLPLVAPKKDIGWQLEKQGGRETEKERERERSEKDTGRLTVTIYIQAKFSNPKSCNNKNIFRNAHFSVVFVWKIRLLHTSIRTTAIRVNNTFLKNRRLSVISAVFDSEALADAHTNTKTALFFILAPMFSLKNILFDLPRHTLSQIHTCCIRVEVSKKKRKKKVCRLWVNITRVNLKTIVLALCDSDRKPHQPRWQFKKHSN